MVNLVIIIFNFNQLTDGMSRIVALWTMVRPWLPKSLLHLTLELNVTLDLSHT
jgi:hypothetical protein